MSLRSTKLRPRRQFGLLVAAAVLFGAAAPCVSASEFESDSIVASRDESGRIVYVNNDAAPAATRTHAPQARPVRRLEYWSVTERRWKPVPPPSPSTMSAARNAAAEVANFVNAAPKATRPATLNPNYRSLGQGRAVSNASIDRLINEAAARHQVDPNLVRAVIKVESNFNPNAVSRTGAMGLMQLMPDTARSLHVVNPFDPAQNVDGGVRHLKRLLETFNGNVPLSVAAYNAGERAVLRRNAVPEFAETKSYVRQVTNLYPAGGASPLAPSNIRVQRLPNGKLSISNVE